MTAAGAWSHQRRLAELTSFLHLLDSVPALPSKNPILIESEPQRSYSLPLKEENELVGVLAFLSSIKDDPNHIPAVAVEECPAHDCLNVLLAVNRATPNDGQAVLEKTKLGFEEIFGALGEETTKGCDDREDRVLSAIISMCHQRILCRLRLASNQRKKPKQAINDVVQEAVNAVSQMRSRQIQDKRLAAEELLGNAKEFTKAVDMWTKHQTQARLKDIIKAAKVLSETPRLRETLDLMSNNLMAPSSRSNLLNTIQKVSRYKEVARSLCRISRKYPLVRRMKVVIVKLPDNAFTRASMIGYAPSIASAIPRHQEPRKPQILAAIYKMLDGEDSANEQFQQRTFTTLKSAKIHAEIQIHFYSRLHASQLPPRVISSSKDACFLCNAFIAMDRGVYTRRCHGRLYPAWLLPTIAGFQGIHQAFNQFLEQTVQSSLTKLLSKSRRYTNPQNESTLLTLITSSSTVATVLDNGLEHHGSNVTTQPSTAVVMEDAGVDFTTAQPTMEATDSNAEPSTSSRAESVGADPGLSNPTPQIIITAPTMSVAGFEPITLSQGERLEHQIMEYTGLPTFKVGGLNIHVENTGRSGLLKQGDHSKTSSLSIEWLTAEKIDCLAEDDKIKIVDAEMLSTEVECVVKDPACIFIAARGSVVRITLPNYS